jgi:hypothetical protein
MRKRFWGVQLKSEIFYVLAIFLRFSFPSKFEGGKGRVITRFDKFCPTGLWYGVGYWPSTD